MIQYNYCKYTGMETCCAEIHKDFTRSEECIRAPCAIHKEFTRSNTAYIHIIAEAKVNHAEAMVAALADKELALKRARESSKADDSPSAKQKLAKVEAEINKYHKQRVLALKKELEEAKPEEEKTDKQKARQAIEWPSSWSHGYTTQAGQVAARKELKQAVKEHGRANSEEKGTWITSDSGFRGSNLFVSRHAVKVSGYEDQLFKLQSTERNGDGPTKILLPEDDDLFFDKPAAWTVAVEEQGEESEEDAEEAAAVAAARAAWVKEWATLTALAGELVRIAAIAFDRMLLHVAA